MTREGQTTDIEKHCYWQEAGSAALATSLHLPANRQIQPTGVIICPSLGHEYVHTFRTFRLLADSLARVGFATLRFDYRSTGNSFDSGECRVEHFVADIRIQMNALRQLLDLDRICLVGFRAGSLFATEASRESETTTVVSWARPRSGKSFAKQIKAIARLSEYPQESDTGLECGGFVYPNSLLGDLAAIGNETDDSSGSERRLRIEVIDGKPASNPHEVRDDLLAVTTAEYEAMTLEPHLAEIPFDTVSAITDWVTKVESGDRKSVEAQALPAAHTDAEITETLVWEPDSALAGVHCEGISGERSTLVVMPNAGSVHSVGPNRIYSEVTRSLARNGIASFRFDLPNLGESVLGNPQAENEPYPNNAASAVENAIDYCDSRWGYKRIVVAGLCSGSYSAFLAALASSREDLTQVVMINPLTFHWEPGLPLRLGSGQGDMFETRHYLRAALSRTNWKRFLRGDVEYMSILRFSIRHTARILRHFVMASLESIRLIPPTALKKKLQAISDKGIRISFIFSSRDPGADLLRAESRSAEKRLVRDGKANITIVENADHTFSQSKHRMELADKLIARISPVE